MSLPVRRGFTLVELIVAILLIDVAILGVVAGTSVAVRRTLESRTRTVAGQTASNRIQTLAADSCVAVTGSSSGATGMAEQWSARPLPNAQRELWDSVVFTLSGVERRIVLRSVVPC
jgi:Tfp pilus assembly protein PilV